VREDDKKRKTERMDSRLRGNDKKQKNWIPACAGMTREGLAIGSSLGIGYWSFNGHWVFVPWSFFLEFVIQNSSLIRHSDFGIRHLLFFLFPTCLIPTA